MTKQSIEKVISIAPEETVVERVYGKVPLSKCVVLNDGGAPIPDKLKTAAWKSADDKAEEIKLDPDYFLRREVLREFIDFLNYPCGDSYWLCGPTGSGKTSFVKQVAVRLNWGLFSKTGSITMEAQQLIGQFKLVSTSPGQPPEMVWVDGPLVKAARSGGIFLLNEADIVDPGEMSAFNDIIEGGSIHIDETGELIKPHPMFRIVVTANSNGTGDETGLYSRVQSQNIAAMDRYVVSVLDYMPEPQERFLLINKFPALADESMSPIVDGMMQLVNDVRSSFKGDNAQARVSLPFSTRSLLRWVRKMQANVGHSSALAYGLELSLLRRARREDVVAINEMAAAIFGENWNPLT